MVEGASVLVENRIRAEELPVPRAAALEVTHRKCSVRYRGNPDIVPPVMECPARLEGFFSPRLG
jgi:hypothetical protein